MFCLWSHVNTAVVLLQVFYYADRIFLSAGVDANNVQYVTVSIDAINVIMTLLAVSFYQGFSSSGLPGLPCLSRVKLGYVIYTYCELLGTIDALEWPLVEGSCATQSD